MSMAADPRPPVDGPRSCTRPSGAMKSTYSSHAAARRFVVRRYRDRDLYPYDCPVCQQVHVAHRRGEA